MRTRWIVALAVVVLSSARAEEKKPIVIGASMSLSGSYAAGGKYSLESTQLWVDDVNQRGGLLGRQVRLVYYDDKSDANTGVQLYEKLITSDKVDLLIGPYSSAVTSAVSTVAEKHHMTMLGPEAADVKIYQRGYKYNFQAQTQASRYMQGALALAKSKGYRKLAMLSEDTAFPKAVASEVVKLAPDSGLEVVFNETYPKGTSDFSALLTKVKQTGADVVFANSYLPDSQGIIRQSRELGVEAKMFAVAVGAAEPEFGNLGSTGEYVFGATQWAATMPWPGNAGFAERYQKKFGRAPDYHSASNYAAGQVLEAALKETGAVDQEKLAAAIRKLKVDTVYGRFEVDSNSIQVGYTSALLQWQKGKQVLVWPEKLAQGQAVLPMPAWSSRQ